MSNHIITIPKIKEIERAYKKAPEKIRGAMATAIARSTILVEAESVKEAPIDTGMLRGRMTRTITPTRGEVYTTVKYALPVHEGTAARTILPKKKKMLAWKKNGVWHYAKKVNHPGTPGNPFFTRAMQNMRGRITAEFEKASKKILDFVAKL